MRLVITDTAKAEITRQLAYLRERNPAAARIQRERISTAGRNLRQTPMIGRPGHVPGTRELVISGTPFLFVYTVSKDTITILHVYHGRQNWRHNPTDDE